MLHNGTYNFVGLGLLCTRHFASSEIGQKLALLTDGRRGFPQLHLANIRVIPQAGQNASFHGFSSSLFTSLPITLRYIFVLIKAFAEIIVKSYNNDV